MNFFESLTKSTPETPNNEKRVELRKPLIQSLNSLNKRLLNFVTCEKNYTKLMNYLLWLQ